MELAFLEQVFNEYQDDTAFAWAGETYSFGWLLDAISHRVEWLKNNEFRGGTVVSLEAELTPKSVAVLLALAKLDCLIVPLTEFADNNKMEFLEIAEVEKRIIFSPSGEVSIITAEGNSSHSLLLQLREIQHAGLILFSSGSTGKSKAVVHDLVNLLKKYQTRRKRLSTIAFFSMDHIGGIDTLFYNLSNGATIAAGVERTPDGVCQIIERYGIEVLPVTPTFINLLLISEAYKRYNLSSLNYVTYGAEVMPKSTLTRMQVIFPDVALLQKYGLSELGTLHSKSKSSDSLWVRIGGEGYKLRVVDNMLEIKADSAMLGYLNAPDPFTEDGWFITGDAVEVDGEYFRILGRTSDIINVGGEKVYPAEVKSVLLSMGGVEEAVITGEPHPLMGKIVTATVKLSTDESLPEFRKRTRRFCKDKLAPYKIPQKVILSDSQLHSARFKQIRTQGGTAL